MNSKTYQLVMEIVKTATGAVQNVAIVSDTEDRCKLENEMRKLPDATHQYPSVAASTQILFVTDDDSYNEITSMYTRPTVSVFISGSVLLRQITMILTAKSGGEMIVLEATV